MFSEEVSERFRKLTEREIKEEGYKGSEAHASDLRSLLAFALIEKEFSAARSVAESLGDEQMMRQVAGLSLSEGSPYDAFSFFEKLKDRTGMISALMEIENSEVNHYSGLIYGSHLIDRMDKESRKWASKKGFPRYKPLFLCKSVALVDATVDNYDLAIGIAKAGLMPAYIAELFGARSRVVESHSDHIKPDKKATFRWIDKLYPSDIKGKNIIVYDKDVVTGRSSGRVLEALLDHNPARVDLGLIHDKCPLIGYGSHFENVNHTL